MRCLSSQQTFFVIQFAEELRAKERKSNYHLFSTGGDFYESSRRRSSRKPHTYIFFWSLDESISSFFGKKKKELVDGNKLLLSMNRKLAIYF